MHEDVQAVPDEGSNISFVEWETGTVMEVERKKQQREKMSTHCCTLSKLVRERIYRKRDSVFE